MPRQTFPHYTINVDDQSMRTVPVATDVGLHNPLFLCFSERGPVNIPIRISGDTGNEIFGPKTFETNSRYFKHPNVFLRKALEYQEVFMVRLADSTAKQATIVLEAAVTPKDLIQYEKASDGSRVVDSEGDYVPLEDAGGDPVEEAGLSITWNARVLTSDETINNLTVKTQVVESVTTTTYPILAFTVSDVGRYGNYIGFKLYYADDYSQTVVENIGAMTYRFAPVELDEDTNIATAIRDLYNSPYIDFSFKEKAYDNSTAMYYTLDDIVRNQYTVTVGVNKYSLLPLSFKVYYTNVNTLVNAIATVSPELEIDAHKINFLSATDENGNLYDHLEVTNAAAYVHKNRINYLLGGSDGTITDAALETLTKSYLEDDVYPQIKDRARYPITHTYDSGYVLATKQSLIKFLGVRDDVKTTLSTQDVSIDNNTAAEDQSTGASLRTSVMLYPESTLYGTPAIRAEIYQQCGLISSDTTYTKSVPYTYDRLIKRCMFEATNKVKGQPTGLPNSQVTAFQNVNWSPSDDDQKQLNWSTALNYAQYYNMSSMHFADYRSVYSYDNSVLSSAIFVDYLIYIKHKARQVWATYAGIMEPSVRMYDSVSKDIDSWIFDTFGGIITSQTTLYKTAINAAEGFSHSVKINIYGNIPMRVFEFTFSVDRMEG